MLNHGTRIEQITEKLAWLTLHVQLSNDQGRTDINKDAENFYCGLLNLVLGTSLKNLNYMQRNYPAVDLGDPNARLAIQVTSAGSRRKIEETLNKFFEYRQDTDYSRLILLIIGKKERNKKPFKVERFFRFDPEQDVWDTAVLCEKIGELPDEKQDEIIRYLDDQMKRPWETPGPESESPGAGRKGEAARAYCFVAQPVDDDVFDRRYEEIIAPAVRNCGLEPCCVGYGSAGVVPVQSMEECIHEAVLVIADITLDDPRVWYELGYAMALNKEVITVCADERTSLLPVNVRHRNVLLYRTKSFSDFTKYQTALENTIADRLGKTAPLSGSDLMTPEEILVLKFIGRDQMNTFAITPEEKILQAHMDSDVVRDCLKALVYKKYLEYNYATDSGNGYYHITPKGENYFRNK